MTDPSAQLLSRLRLMPGVEAQNALMRLTDRELALCMMHMPESDRALLLSFLAKKKADRVLGECRLHRRVNISYDQYRATVVSVLRQVSGSGERASGSYLRPRRR